MIRSGTRHAGWQELLPPEIRRVAANFLRDVQHAALVHAIDKGGNLEGFVRNIPASMAAITRELRGKAEPLTIAETGTLDVLDTADRQELIRQFGRERVMDTLYDYFRENGGETGFVHSKDIAEAEKGDQTLRCIPHGAYR